MSWTVDVNGTAPGRLLTRIGNIASEFPGGDDLDLKIGNHVVTLKVLDCPELRVAIDRALPQI